jgi:hypothetical protein
LGWTFIPRCMVVSVWVMFGQALARASSCSGFSGEVVIDDFSKLITLCVSSAPFCDGFNLGC